MSVDIEDLRSTIRSIKQKIVKQQIAGLDEDVDRLEQIADRVEGTTGSTTDHLTAVGVMAPVRGVVVPALPPGVRVRDPHEIVTYLNLHPDMTGVVARAASALVDEFRGERSEIELVLYRDPEIEDRTLTFYVRVLDYEHLVERLSTVLDRLDDTLAQGSEMLLITTDYRPIE